MIMERSICSKLEDETCLIKFIEHVWKYKQSNPAYIRHVLIDYIEIVENLIDFDKSGITMLIDELKFLFLLLDYMDDF